MQREKVRPTGTRDVRTKAAAIYGIIESLNAFIATVLCVQVQMDLEIAVNRFLNAFFYNC